MKLSNNVSQKYLIPNKVKGKKSKRKGSYNNIAPKAKVNLMVEGGLGSSGGNGSQTARGAETNSDADEGIK